MSQILRSFVLIAAMTVMALSSGARAEPNVYLCTVDQAAGLHYDKQTKAWGPRAFLKSKYFLRRLTNDDRDKAKGRWWALLQPHPKAEWAFFEFGKDAPMPLAACIEFTDG